MKNSLLNRITREAIVRSTFFLPEHRRRRLERYLRGKEQFASLQAADVAVVSFGKSGRTWLRTLLWRFYQQRLGLSERSFAGFGSGGLKKGKAMPRLFFTHDNYLKDYTGNAHTKTDYAGKKVVLLVRDPRDTGVSQYFQWKFRMRDAKKVLNDYPDSAADIPAYDFLVHEGGGGVPTIIGFLNDWIRARAEVEDLLVVRYEDLKRDTTGEFARILRFIGEEAGQDEIAECTAYASVDNMRALETKRTFRRAGSRMQAKDKTNPDSFKVRRAKVGGWRDYLSDTQAAKIEALIERDLLPGFGYRLDEQAPAQAMSQAAARA